MADKEIYKNRVITHPNGDREEVHEDIREHDNAYHHVEHVYHDDAYDRRHDLRRRGLVRHEILSFRRGVYLLLDIAEIILVAEFFIRMLGLPATNPFISVINTLSYPLLAPFGSIVTWVAPGILLDWAILAAILVYGILAYLVIALFESGLRATYRHH